MYTFMQIFRQTLKAKQEKTQAWVDNSAQKIKKQRATFQVRKKNLADLNATKSRFNYLSQVNQEMQAIKQYQVPNTTFSNQFKEHRNQQKHKEKQKEKAFPRLMLIALDDL